MHHLLPSFPKPSRLHWLHRFLIHVQHAPAELPFPRLDTVYPPGGKVDSTVKVSVGMQDGAEVRELHFSHPGLKGVWKEKGSFEVQISQGVPVGNYEVRAAGSLGMSNPRSFMVGVESSVALEKGTSSVGEAVLLQSGSLAFSRAPAANSDHFKVRLKAGERALLQCLAQSLDSRLRPVLEVLDAAGRRLSVKTFTDSAGTTVLDFTAPTAGDFVIRVHDLTFAGGPEHCYALKYSNAPYVDFIDAPVLQVGGKRSVRLFGRQLPGSKPSDVTGVDGVRLEEKLVEVDVPGLAQLDAGASRKAMTFEVDGFSYRLDSHFGPSPGRFIAVSALPPVSEKLPKDSGTAGTPFSAPAVLSGHFYPAGDVDTWTFEVKKGEVWRAEVFSNRLGHPSNPFLLVQQGGRDLAEAWGPDADAGGKFLPLASNDPSARIEIKEDGVCSLTVRDLSGTQRSDPSRSYFMEVRRETPDFKMLASILPPPEVTNQIIGAPYSAQLRAGGTLAVRVLVSRLDGFTGDIEVYAEGLPAGVACVPTRILSGKNEGYLVLSAQEKIEPFTGPIQIKGRADIGGKSLERAAKSATTRWGAADANQTPMESYLTQNLVLRVLPDESAPLAIAAAPDAPAEVAANGKLEVPLNVVRRGEFKEILRLKTNGAPGVDKIKEVEIQPKENSAKAVLDMATLKLAAGAHTIYFTALTKGKFRGKDVTTTIFSPPFTFVVK